MKLTLEIERETDGRWIADVVDLPGVMTYGQTRQEAITAARALAFRVLAEKVEHGELDSEVDSVHFRLPEASLAAG